MPPSDPGTYFARARGRLQRCLLGTGAGMLACWSIAAFAAGLGPIVEQSSLGQSLRVAIPLLLGPGEEIAAECFRLVAAERDPEGIPQALYGRVALERIGEGTRIVVTDGRLVNDPVLRLTVQVGCDRGVRREYTLLMDPPVVDVPLVAEEAATAPVAPVAPVAAAPRERRRTAEGVPTGSTAARAAPQDSGASAPTTRKKGPAKARTPAKVSAPRRPPPASVTEEPRLKVSRAAPGTTADATADAGGKQGPTAAEVQAQQDLANALEAETVVLRQRVAELSALVDRMQEQVRVQEAQRQAAEAAAKAAEEAKSSPLSIAAAWWQANWLLVITTVGLPALIAAGLRWRRRGTGTADVLPIGRATPSRFGTMQSEGDKLPPSPAGEKASAPKPDAKGPAGAGSSELAVSELSQITEEARVYVALGHADRAMTVLREHIHHAPRAMPAAWMMLLDLYHANGRRQDFRQLAQEFHQHCNVQAPTWESFAGRERDAAGLHEYPHVTQRLVGLWRLPECREYLERLLLDNREGRRGGFSIAAYGDILMLLQILDAPAVDIDSDLAEEGKLRTAWNAAAREANITGTTKSAATPARRATATARPTQTSIDFDVDADPPERPTPRPK